MKWVWARKSKNLKIFIQYKCSISKWDKERGRFLHDWNALFWNLLFGNRGLNPGKWNRAAVASQLSNITTRVQVFTTFLCLPSLRGWVYWVNWVCNSAERTQKRSWESTRWLSSLPRLSFWSHPPSPSLSWLDFALRPQNRDGDFYTMLPALPCMFRVLLSKSRDG